MDANMMAQSATFNALGGSFNEYFGDNPVVKFMFQFMLIGTMGYFTQQIPTLKTKVYNFVVWLFDMDNETRPRIKLMAKEKTSKWSDKFVSGKRFKSWMFRIRRMIEKGEVDNDVLKQLDNKGHHGYSSDSTNEQWIPMQEAGSDPWKLTDKLWVRLQQNVLEKGKEDSSSDSCTEVKLEIFTTEELGLPYLLEQTEEVIKSFDEEKNNELLQGPHIFFFEGKKDNGQGSEENTWDTYPFSSTRTVDHIWFEQKDDFLSAYDNFLENKEVYERRGDPYTFSALLYGTPGCGKSSLLKAVVRYDWDRDLKSHLLIIPFSKIKTADDLRTLMFDKSIGDYKIPYDQRIYVFEDFDASKNAKVFAIRQRLGLGGDDDDKGGLELDILRNLFGGGMEEDVEEEKTEKDKEDGAAGGGNQQKKKDGKFGDEKLNLSDVLNILDGLNERTGQRCFWTTNLEPPEEHFDPAFLRPGRMDMIIQFTKCTAEGLHYLINQYYGSDIDFEEVEEFDDYVHSPAKIKQFCKESKTPEEVIELLREGHEVLGTVLAQTNMAVMGSGHQFLPQYKHSVVPPKLKRYISNPT